MRWCWKVHIVQLTGFFKLSSSFRRRLWPSLPGTVWGWSHGLFVLIAQNGDRTVPGGGFSTITLLSPEMGLSSSRCSGFCFMSFVNAERLQLDPALFISAFALCLWIFIDIYERSSKNARKNVKQQCSLQRADGMQNQSRFTFHWIRHKLFIHEEDYFQTCTTFAQTMKLGVDLSWWDAVKEWREMTCML